MMKRIAVIGAGRMGQIHAGNLAGLSGVELAGIHDPVPEAAGRLAQRLGTRSATLDELLSDPSIDAIAITSPTTTHSDLIRRGAAARKHIFCEKPIDLSVERARACAQSVRDAGVACMIGFQRRFDPTFNEACGRLRRGDIGEPELLVVTSRDPGAPPPEYIAASGGIFRDMLIHDFDVFRWLMCSDGDAPESLVATGSVLTDPSIAKLGDVDTTAVTIRTQRGRLCQINTSRRAAYGYDQRFEVLGALGMLQCANVTPYQVSQWDAHGLHTEKPEAFFLQRYAAAYRAEMEHFFSSLRDGTPFLSTVEDGLQAQLLADAAARSLSSGQWEAL